MDGRDAALGRYRDALGQPGRGVHGPRLFGLAAFDVLGTLTLAAAIAAAFRSPARPAVFATAAALAFAALWLLAIAVHWVFDVRTALSVALGLAPGQ